MTPNTDAASQPWFAPLAGLASLGATTAKAKRMADLHELRTLHLGQFWTPEPVARLMWRIALVGIKPALARSPGSKVAILDNSIGSGRLVQFANPEQHLIAGIDVHEPSLNALGDQLAATGFEMDLLNAGMEEVHPTGFGVCLINPPFSLHFETALLQPYSCCAHGRYGPASSAISHVYALHQALEAAQLVVALLPRTAADDAMAEPEFEGRLQAVFHLPGNAFENENANVATSILVFGRDESAKGAPVVLSLSNLDIELPALNLFVSNTAERRPKPLRRRSYENEKPTITTPVTGNTAVRVYRRRKDLRLAFACGLVEAKVLNAIHRDRIDRYGTEGHRYPGGVRTTGQGLLDVELHLMQADPLASFQRLLRTIHKAGGRTTVAPGLLPYLARRARLLRIQTTPLRHTVWVPAGGDIGGDLDRAQSVVAITEKKQLLAPKLWGSPVLQAGQSVTFDRVVTAGAERFEHGKPPFRISLARAELLERFQVPACAANQDSWVLKHPGRRESFPQKAQALRNRALALGLDRWLTWDFQLDDLIELSMTPGGVVCGAQMGLGKARLATSLALLGGGDRNLIVVEAQLIEEFIAELRALGVPQDDWQVIDGPEALGTLKRLNLISYTRLRMAVTPTRRKVTYGKALRGRIHTLLADEAHCISNDSTDQVRALYNVSPKRRYAFTGTPVGNYTRGLLPLIVWVAGDGTAAQPYGKHRPFLEPRLIESMMFASRGVDKFREQFVTTEWITSVWAESMSDGAKREVPSLRSIDAYREYAGRFVLRRLWGEPEVSKFVKVPEPTREVIELDWDDDHLAFYLETAEDFAEWWRELRRNSGADMRQINLVAVLARIGAVFQAANVPQQLEGPGRRFTGRTSKQRAIVEQLTQYHEQGDKTLVFANSPLVLNLIHQDLASAGIESVRYTGEQTLTQRTKALNDRFRNGPASIALLSFGVGQTGLNLPQANREVFYNRCWSQRQELQALYRAVRPSQRRTVRASFLHLRGSLDEYMARMVAMKADAANAGLDFGTPEYQATDFIHWVTVLDEFCENLAMVRGLQRRDLRQALATAA